MENNETIIIRTYGGFGKAVKRLSHPSLSSIFKTMGISDQLGNYYLKQAVLNPDKSLGRHIEIPK